MTPTNLQWVKPTQQARSQQTLERLLDAAEAQILEHGLDSITIKDVARRAESSVGAFYARFSDKEALLRTVFQRFCEQAEATIDAVLVPDQWHDADFEQLLRLGIGFLIRVFRERGRLIAAFTLRAAQDPEISSLGQRLGVRICERLLMLLDERNEQLAHPNPDVAIKTFVWLVLSALEARALHTVASDPELTDTQITAELSHMALAYLAVAPPPRNNVAASPSAR